MRPLLHVAGFVLRDLARSHWLLAYMLLLLAGSGSLLTLSGSRPAGLAGLTSLVLLIVPLVSVVVGITYLEASRDFLAFMLAQPVSRAAVYGGLYGGLALALTTAFLLGCGPPLLATAPAGESPRPAATLLLLAGGVLLTCAFLSLAFLAAALVRDRVRALGAGLMVWLFSAILFDALLLAFTVSFADYPLERPLLLALMLNPIDLARVLVLLHLDTAALLGYTGAVFQEFFGRAAGVVSALAALLAWTALPLGWALHRVERADL